MTPSSSTRQVPALLEDSLDRRHNDHTVTKMTSYIEFVPCSEALPKTIKYCKTCQRETMHQIRGGRGLAANICIACLERALAWEQDRD